MDITTSFNNIYIKSINLYTLKVYEKDSIQTAIYISLTWLI